MLGRTRIAILLISLSVAGLGLLLGPMSPVAYATACNKGGSCTFYYPDNSTTDGKCGQYQGATCDCGAGNDQQAQSACNLVQ